MPAPYNLSNITSASNLPGLLTVSNQMVNGLYGILLLVSIFMITFIASKQYYTKSALFTASFITALASMMLFFSGWVSQTIMLMCFVILAISYILLRL